MKIISVAAKRNDPTYQQLSGHIPVELARTFKAACTLRGIDHSSGLEQALHLWLKTTPTAEIASSSKSSTEFDAATLLKLFTSGKRPTDGELVIVANESDIELEQLWQLRDRLFPQKKKMNNGAT